MVTCLAEQVAHGERVVLNIEASDLAKVAGPGLAYH